MTNGVRHEIVILDQWPRNIFFLKCININCRRGINEIHVCILMLITIINERIDVLEASELVRAREVHAHQNHDVTFRHLDTGHHICVIL